MIGKMENIELKNKEFLDDLSKFQRFATPEFYEHLECLNKEYLTKEKREHFTGVPYLKNLLSHKEKHDGYPERGLWPSSQQINRPP